MGIAEGALALSAGGGLLSAFGKMQAGEAAGAAGDYRAQVAENNAVIARQNSNTSLQVGELDVGRQGLRSRAQSGAIKSGMAASGVDVNTGSYGDVQAAASELQQLDALTIRSDAARKAYGYNIEETNQKSTAALERAGADQSRTAGLLNATGSLLASAGSISSQYWKGNQRGLVA